MNKLITESQLRRIVKEAVEKLEMGRGELSVDASYSRIENAIERLRKIADDMHENGYYETEESALRCSVDCIDRELFYIRNNTNKTRW